MCPFEVCMLGHKSKDTAICYIDDMRNFDKKIKKCPYQHIQLRDIEEMLKGRIADWEVLKMDYLKKGDTDRALKCAELIDEIKSILGDDE